MARPRPLVAGNWKMNGSKVSLIEVESVKHGLSDITDVDIVICPPATLLSRATVVAGSSPVRIGGQDCHPRSSGAHTGDLAAEMLADAGATFVIVGHSERRADHREDDLTVRAKAEAAWRAGLTAILCVGETESQRRGGETLAVIDRQLANSVPDGTAPGNLVIAYEPVWAIGTGLTATPEIAEEAHAHLRSLMAGHWGDAGAAVRVLYGGSVTPENSAGLAAMPNVDGGLVGGASFDAGKFLGIISSFAA